MIAEVNNTFDERRMYFLPYSMSAVSAEEATSQIEQSRRQMPQKFSHTFAKDFHVSPFSSRKGGYTLTAQDPLASVGQNDEVIANVVATLRSSKGHGKLVARLLSTSRSLDPSSMSFLRKVVFLLSWSVTGWVTFPRIVLEAIKLAQRRGLSIWYRPEVNPGTVGRNSTPEEDALEFLFRKYLEAKVCSLDGGVNLHYQAAEQLDPSFSRQLTMASHNTGNVRQEDLSTVELNVVTPAFYSRFVYYHSDKAAFANEILDDNTENRTARLSDERLSSALAQAIPCNHLKESATSQDNLIRRLGWALLRRLRRSPDRGLYPYPAIPSLREGEQKPPEATNLLFSDGLSDFDEYIKSSRTKREQDEYRRIVTRIFLSGRIALGSVFILQIYGFILGCMAVYCIEWFVRDAVRIGTCFDDLARVFRLGIMSYIYVWLEQMYI